MRSVVVDSHQMAGDEMMTAAKRTKNELLRRPFSGASLSNAPGPNVIFVASLDG